MEKIKLILVDDELTSRNMIKKYLENNDVYEVVADFQNGKTALEWLRKNTVDILLCDMQMPEMNGVELMRNVHIIDEYLPVIAISGFDDFNFVRGSLVNGAANYLLKHELSKEYLINVLDQVREQYRIIPKEKPVYKKKGYCIREASAFTEDNIVNLVNTEQIDFCCNNVCCIGISPDYKVRNDLNLLEYKQDISKAVIDMISQILGDNYSYINYVTKNYHILSLVSFENEKSMLYMMNMVSNIAARLQRTSVRMLDTTLSIVCGEVHGKLGSAIDETKLMLTIMEDKFYCGGNRIVYTAVTKPVIYSDELIPDKIWKQLDFEIENRMHAYIDTIGSMLDLMEKQQIKKKLVMENCEKILQLITANGYMEESTLQDLTARMLQFEFFDEFRLMISDELRKKTQNMWEKEKKQYSPNITQVVEYINKNYATDISLEKCAEIVGCSYTSLSKEFKKETGMRFVEYLNIQRVNKAKSLLIRKDVSMKKIVELAGFRNYNYFFKVFKEIVGVTPSEFVAKK